VGKVTKRIKRAKPKLKKKSTSKTRSQPSIVKKISSAPENKAKLQDIKQTPSDNLEPAEITFRILRKAMRVKHIECEDKAIRTALQALNKINQSGTSTSEIEDAKMTLQIAINDKEDAAKWMHPNETIEKLSHILNVQIENSEEVDIIEMTKEFISDAKESLRYIDQGQEDAFFLQLIQTHER